VERTPIDWTSLTDEEFVEIAERQLWLSAFAANNPKAPAHAEVDAAYDDAVRRSKPWLYNRAYNLAADSCGFSVSDRDREAATEEGWLKQKAQRDDHYESIQHASHQRSTG